MSPPPPRRGSQGEAPFGSFFAARRGTIKYNFTAVPHAGKERSYCLFWIKIIVHFSNFSILHDEKTSKPRWIKFVHMPSNGCVNTTGMFL